MGILALGHQCAGGSNLGVLIQAFEGAGGIERGGEAPVGGREGGTDNSVRRKFIRAAPLPGADLLLWDVL